MASVAIVNTGGAAGTCTKCLEIGAGGPDLMIGTPKEDIGSVVDSGMASVMYDAGSSVDSLYQGVTVNGTLIPGTPEEFDYFSSGMPEDHGGAMAFGDFNNDTYDDVAIGIPYEDVGSIVNSGIVEVFYGGVSGTFESVQVLHQGTPFFPGSPETNDRFGWSLATQRLGSDAYDDLVIGVPFEGIGAVPSAGLVQIVHGGPTGLNPADVQNWHQNTSGVAGTVEANDRFGWAVEAAAFSDVAWGAVIVGTPFEDIGAVQDAGIVQAFYAGSDGDIATANQQTFHQDTPGIGGVVEAFDRFGEVLEAGGFGSGYFDLAVGVPYEGVGSKSDAGIVQIIYGDFSGLTTADVGGGSNRYIVQGESGFGGTPETGDHLGAALAAIPGPGSDDLLAIGSPGEAIGIFDDAGLVHIRWPNDRSGLLTVHQGTAGILGENESFDHFGAALAFTDINSDGTADLVIGGPGENSAAGRIWILEGDATGITATDRIFEQGTAPFPGTPEGGDRFGAVILGGSTA